MVFTRLHSTVFNMAPPLCCSLEAVEHANGSACGRHHTSDDSGILCLETFKGGLFPPHLNGGEGEGGREGEMEREAWRQTRPRAQS